MLSRASNSRMRNSFRHLSYWYPDGACPSKDTRLEIPTFSPQNLEVYDNYYFGTFARHQVSKRMEDHLRPLRSLDESRAGTSAEPSSSGY